MCGVLAFIKNMSFFVLLVQYKTIDGANTCKSIFFFFFFYTNAGVSQNYT